MNNLSKLIAVSVLATGFAAPVFAQDSFEVMSASCVEFSATSSGSREELVNEIKAKARGNSMLYLLEPDQARRIFEAACEAYPDGTVLEAVIANMM